MAMSRFCSAFLAITALLPCTLATAVPGYARNSVQARDARPPPATSPFCTPYQNPDQGVAGYCQCANGMHVKFDPGANPCPYVQGQVIDAALIIDPNKPTPQDVQQQSENAATLAKICSDATVNDMRCWIGLGLTSYVSQWWKDNASRCSSAGFANCWYSLKTRYGKAVCDQLNTHPACSQPLWDDFKDNPDGAKDYYVTWAIYNTNALFLDMYNGIGNADETIQASLASVIQALSPQKPDTKALEYLLDALTFGLALYAEGDLLTKALLRTLPQSSTLGGKLFPVDNPLEGQFDTWAEISDKVADLTTAWKNSVADGLPVLLNNVTLFTAWGDSSPITGAPEPLNKIEGSLAQAIGTYASSAIINDLGLVVTRAVQTDVYDLQKNGTKTRWPYPACDGGYDKTGGCDGFFYDGADTYAIIDPSNHQKNFYDAMVKLTSGPNPPTTGKLLFTGGLECTQTCGKNGGCSPKESGQDFSQAACLSSLRICTWTYDTYGPFQKGCEDVLPDFGKDKCDGSEPYKVPTGVPFAYLGGGILLHAPGEWAGHTVCNTPNSRPVEPDNCNDCK